MEILSSFILLGKGILSCLTLQNLLCCTIGSLIGSLIGVLPGIGISGTVAILLPVTYGFDPLTALIMLSGIYFGSAYGVRLFFPREAPTPAFRNARKRK